MTLRSHLVADATYWHRLWSVRMAIVTAALGTASEAFRAMPDDWKQAVPLWIVHSLGISTVASALATGAARVIAQATLPGRRPLPTVTTPAPAPPPAAP